MKEVLFWIYLLNALFLMIHEIESAYWKEWELFKIKGGVTGFLIFHFPILFLFMYGLILVFQQTFEGYIVSLLLSFAGLFAFTIHMYFIKELKKRSIQRKINSNKGQSREEERSQCFSSPQRVTSQRGNMCLKRKKASRDRKGHDYVL